MSHSFNSYKVVKRLFLRDNSLCSLRRYSLMLIFSTSSTESKLTLILYKKNEGKKTK